MSPPSTAHGESDTSPAVETSTRGDVANEMQERTLKRVRKLAEFLDDQFEVRGVRFGWDGLIGLVPGIGDLLTAGIAAYVIWLARDQGSSKWTLSRMLWNSGVDLVIGAVPLVGDLADVAWKSNLKNVRLLERELQTQVQQRRHASKCHRPSD